MKPSLSNDTKAYDQFRDWAQSLERLNEANIRIKKIQADMKAAVEEVESAERSEKEKFDRLDWYRSIAHIGGQL